MLWGPYRCWDRLAHLRYAPPHTALSQDTFDTIFNPWRSSGGLLYKGRDSPSPCAHILLIRSFLCKSHEFKAISLMNTHYPLQDLCLAIIVGSTALASFAVALRFFARHRRKLRYGWG